MKVSDLAKTGLFAALTAAGGFVRFPLGPVPFTLQTFFVLLAGIVLGPRLGAASQAIYILLGLIGLPVFASGGGPGYLWQPSFGYLPGFILAAWVTGRLVNGDGETLRPSRALAAATLGTAAVYLIGVPYLYVALNYFVGQTLPWSTVLKVGLLVFLPGDILKLAAVALIAPRVRRLL